MALSNNTTFPTIVTMFYDIRKKENSNPQDNRQFNKYIELANNFILKLPYPLIIFVDDSDNDELIKFISSSRAKYVKNTHIYKIKFEETYYYKYLDTLHILQNKFTILNGDMNHETPLYIILNNNKFFFMECVIKLNIFNSSHFIWMDFGINHVALDCDNIHKWILTIPDNIKQLCINPYLESIDNKQMFQYIYHHTAGGLFSGSIDNILKYCELFKKQTEQIYDNEWYQIDEAVMTMVQRDNPDLFDLYYGDYNGIISNYFEPIHNIHLILTGIQKSITYNNRKLAFKMLMYCHAYFEKNMDSELIYDYIKFHIIIDYYNTTGILLPEVIFIINNKLLKQDHRMIELIKINESNLNFYVNKQLIITI